MVVVVVVLGLLGLVVGYIVLSSVRDSRASRGVGPSSGAWYAGGVTTGHVYGDSGGSGSGCDTGGSGGFSDGGGFGGGGDGGGGGGC